jgi:hypothetical protein
VTFFRSNQEPSVMRICFECGDIEWNATNDSDPPSLFGAVGQLVVSIGLQPTRDWRALAEEHLKTPRPK